MASNSFNDLEGHYAYFLFIQNFAKYADTDTITLTTEVATSLTINVKVESLNLDHRADNFFFSFDVMKLY